MYGKLIGATLALAAFAVFVLPATSAAANDPTLTENGVSVATGSRILGTQINGISVFEETGGTDLWQCSIGSMTGELTKNSGGTVEGKVTSASFSGTAEAAACTGTLAVLGMDAFITPKVSASEPWCLSSTPLMAEDEWQLRKCGEGNLTFTIDVITSGPDDECKYERSGAVKGNYTTEATGDAILTVTATSAASGFTGESGNPGICKTSGKLGMSFTLETDTTSSADPLRIS